MAAISIGPIIQAAYVVEDIHGAVARWTKEHGVGPFAVMDRVVYPVFEYEAAASRCELALAFAYSGDLQIELIQQLSDAPSLFVNATGAPLLGFHHLGVLSHDIDADEVGLLRAGLQRRQRAVSMTGTEVRYYSGGPGGLLELIKLADGGVFFDRLKRAAASWDGTSPYLE